MYELCQTISLDHPALKEDLGILTHTFEGGFQRQVTNLMNGQYSIYRNVREDGYMETDICFPLK
ncbi:MAG: hypothetical protein ACI4PH_07215 [Faecousia sp.]